MGMFGPKSNKKALGERSQAIIIYRLLEVGYNILTPYGDNTRYDLVIEGRLLCRVLLRYRQGIFGSDQSCGEDGDEAAIGCAKKY